MKKISYSIRVFAIVIGLLLFINIPVLATTGKSTAANVRVRESASTDAEVIDLLAVDDTVEILSEEGDWYKVSFKGKTGYVSKSFISTKENDSEKSNNQNTEENTNQTGQDNSENSMTNQTSENTTSNKAYKMAEKTNVYILPVLTSELIGELQKDDEVTLISNAGLWVYIKAEKVTGWVRIDKLSTENVTTNNTDNKDNNDQQNNDDTENEDNIENNDNTENSDNTQNDDANKDEQNNSSSDAGYTAKTMYCVGSSVNVRSEANTSSSAVDSLGINTQVNVVGEENDWYKVEVNGKSGYIRKDLLSDEKQEVSSRSNDIDRTAAQQQADNSSAESNVVSTTDNSTTNVSSTTQNVTTTTTQATTQSSTETSGISGNDIVAYAKQFLGCRYVYGASGPSSFDCSGLTMYVYKHFGYSLSHSSRVQATQGTAVTGELQAGDILVFSNDGKTIGHVGIYIGNDQFIHASDSSTGVIISNLSDSWNKSKYRGARRIL